jgi:ATP-binding cassette subfamily F protein uup
VATPAAVRAPARAPAPRRDERRRLSYNEQRELAALPDRILALEQELQELEVRVSSADFYRQDGPVIAAALRRLEELTREIQSGYERWGTLDTAGDTAN